jgi:hypothetical protein
MKTKLLGVVAALAVLAVASPAHSDFLGFLYSDGGYTTIAPPGSSSSFPTAINASGQIVGSYRTGSASSGFLYSGGSYTNIAPPGSTFAGAQGINASG